MYFTGTIDMLVAIPILTFFILFLYLLGQQSNEALDHSDWRSAFPQACLYWGGLIALFSELLSIVDGISRLWLGVLWGLALGVLLSVGWYKGTFHEAWVRIKTCRGDRLTGRIG